MGQRTTRSSRLSSRPNHGQAPSNGGEDERLSSMKRALGRERGRRELRVYFPEEQD